MKWFLLLLITNAFTGAFGQQLNCDSVRTGFFETPTQNIGMVLVERNDSLHIETIPQINKQTISKVIWEDACHFRLEHFKGDIPPGPNGTKPILCEITEVSADFHIVRSQIEGTDIISDYKMFHRDRNK